MLTEPVLVQTGGAAIIARVPVFLRDDSVWSESTQQPLGTINRNVVVMLARLCEQDGVALQTYCTSSVKSCLKSSKSSKRSRPSYAKLCIIIYGPVKLSDDVGDFITRCNMYLQDPMHCDRNVQYRNPHRLFSSDDISETTQNLSVHPISEYELFESPNDLLAGLEYEDELPETETPSALLTTLFPFVPPKTPRATNP